MKKFVVGLVLVLATICIFPLAQAWGQTTNSASAVARLLGIKPLSINGVPDALPIGTTNAVRSYIVGDNGAGINVFVSLGFVDGTEFRELYYPTEATWGYSSYDAFLDFCTQAGTQLLSRFGREPNTVTYKPGQDVWATVEVRYLDGPRYRVGLFISKSVGPLATITEETIRRTFSLATESITEQLIIPIPNLKHHRVEVVMENGTTNFFDWDMGIVTTSPSWPIKDSSTNSWVALRGWYCTGKYPVRITIETTSGMSATYTQFGDKLVAPVMKMIDKQTLRISAARGSKVKIYSSADNIVWKLATSFSFTSDNAYGTTVPIVSLADKLFFKATCE